MSTTDTAEATPAPSDAADFVAPRAGDPPVTADLPESTVDADPDAIDGRDPADPPGKDKGAPDDKDRREATPPAERDPARRLMELSTVSDAALSRRYIETCLEPSGKLKRNLTPDEVKLSNIYGLMHDEKVDGVFVRGSDNDIMLPEPRLDIPDPHGGAAHKFGPDELRLASIKRAEDDMLVCTFNNSKDGGRPILDSLGQPLEIRIPRAEIINAQLAAERAIYEGLLEGNDKKVLTARIDALAQSGAKVPTPDIDSAIEASTRNMGVPTATDIREVLQKISPTDKPPSDEVKQLLKSLDGKVVLTLEDFQNTVAILGGSSEAFAKMGEELSTEIRRLSDIVKGDPTNTSAQARLEAAQAQQALIGNAYQLFSEAEARGENPFDALYNKAQKGELNPAQAKAFVEALKDGDFEPLVDMLLQQRAQDMAPDELARWKKNTIRALKGGALVGGTPLGIAALLAAIATALVLGAAISMKPQR